MKVSNSLLTLLGIAIGKYPTPLTLDDIYVLSEVVPNSIAVPERVRSIPIEKTKCWSCVRLRQRKDGRFACPINAYLSKVLPRHFGEKCPSFASGKELRSSIQEARVHERWKKKQLEATDMNALRALDSPVIPESRIEVNILGYCEDCSNYGLLNYI